MTPPRLAHRLLEIRLDPQLADSVIGDLDEIFAAEARKSPPLASYRYWRRTAGALWHLRRGGPSAARQGAGDGPMTTTLRDFLRGSRLFVSQPAFAWAAVVTLALAIGANTLIFTIANVLVLKPLPFRSPETLGWILVTMPGSAPDRAGVSLPEYAAFKAEAPTLGHLAAWRRQPVTLRERRESDRVLAQLVIGDLQGLWGLHALRGRLLSLADEQQGAPRVAVLSHRFWNTRFGAADDVVGRDVLVDGTLHTVVGILTPDIELGNLSEIDLWVPYAGDPSLASRSERGWRPVGRLEDGTSHTDANAQVRAIADRLELEHLDVNRDWIARVGTTREALGGANTWIVLSLLAVVVGLLLLLACANVMNLLIARLIGRRQELAVRTALGATRGQVVRQIVSESLMLGLVGGALGLGLAWVGLRGIHAVATEPFFQQLAFDFRVLLFAIGLSFVAPLTFSILPTLRVLRDDVRATLSEGSTRSVGSATAARGRSSLVVLQVSLAVTLLIVAALVVQTMQAVVAADLGYDPSKLITAQVDVPAWKVQDEQAALQIRQRVLARVKQLPGAIGAASTTVLPALQLVPLMPFDIDGRPATDERSRPSAGLNVVSADYFAVVGLPMLAGRGFVEGDTSSSRPVAVVSAEAARRFWPTPADAVGSTIRIADTAGRPLEASVIGVARNLANPIIVEPPSPALYVLDEHRPTRGTNILIRAEAPGALAAALRAAISDVDPDLPAYRLQTMVAAMQDENSSNHLLSGMFAAFALIAILLATAGLYGVMSYAVSQRSGEIALRIALGAPTRSIARQVVGQSVKLAALGTLIGVIGAYGLARAVASLLFGVTPSDPATYIGAVALTLIAALVATWLPMRRAATIDPLESLRHT
jgi:putative ABC transport system permease protein